MEKMLIPAAAARTWNLLDFMAPFGASSGNNIKLEETTWKTKICQLIFFFFINNFYWKTVVFPECLSCLENPQNLWFMTEMVSFSLGYQRQHEKAGD